MGFYYAGERAAKNPMIGIQNLPVVKEPPDPLTVDERDRVLAHMDEKIDPRVGAYFRFAFFTGLRPEEIIALHWTDLDEAHGTIRVQRVRTFKGSVRKGSKTHAVRDVDLLPPALDALAVMKPYTRLAGKDIFQHPDLEAPWHDERSQRDRYWRPALAATGVRFRRAYATRHTYATVALMGGVNPAYVARQMGHKSTKMFFEVYARWIDGADKSRQRRAMEEAFRADSSLILPQQPEATGRRDWIRTNSPRKRP
jgi:integrase